jgi:hypothetical protein
MISLRASNTNQVIQRVLQKQFLAIIDAFDPKTAISTTHNKPNKNKNKKQKLHDCPKRLKLMG